VPTNIADTVPLNYHQSFKASFATFSALNNDENTRTFLTLEVGAGHETVCLSPNFSANAITFPHSSYFQLSILANSLNPVLSALRQQGYYSKPRFHASIAWGLLDSLKGNEAQSSDSSPKTDLSTTLPKAPPSPSENVSAAKSEIETALFPTIPCLPPSLIPNLIEKYGLDLVSPKVGSFEVGSIVVQIGKDTSEWNLGDIR
jgi:U6 snRNA phosphodiesterase